MFAAVCREQTALELSAANARLMCFSLSPYATLAGRWDKNLARFFPVSDADAGSRSPLVVAAAAVAPLRQWRPALRIKNKKLDKRKN
jgi:hypothetical protein